jgi:hypothetical protein
MHTRAGHVRRELYFSELVPVFMFELNGVSSYLQPGTTPKIQFCENTSIFHDISINESASDPQPKEKNGRATT